MSEARHPFERGPYLNAAVLCEKVLQERDGVNSVIRIVDRLTLTASGPEPPEEMLPMAQTLWLYVGFKSGTARGVKQLTVRLQKPSGKSPPVQNFPLNFEGEDDRGINLAAQMTMEIDEVGVWWFDLNLDGVPVTRLPLRVIYLRQPTPGTTQGGRPQ